MPFKVVDFSTKKAESRVRQSRVLFYTKTFLCPLSCPKHCSLCSFRLFLRASAVLSYESYIYIYLFAIGCVRTQFTKNFEGVSYQKKISNLALSLSEQDHPCKWKIWIKKKSMWRRQKKKKKRKKKKHFIFSWNLLGYFGTFCEGFNSGRTQ